MNKKQLIVAWAMGTLISMVFLFNVYKLENTHPVFSYKFILVAIMMSIPILIIGRLLIYTLRDKKK